MFIRKRKNKGFGLIEVIVGITMLLLTSIAALTLARSVTRFERFNEQRLVAYNLAQMVMEETRRKRDSAWDDLKRETRWEDVADGQIIVDSLNDYYFNYGTEGDRCDDSGNDTIVCNLDNNEYTIVRQVAPLSQTISELDGTGIETMSDTVARRVFVDVMWFDQGQERHLDLTTILTDWKPMI